MKEAISIYLGGEIITPDLCDYDSYKQLGLKCPFCHSPVFLRQGTVYEKGDKQINRDACFAHFKADLEQGELCEARAITKAGREEIEAIKRKSRNQRLRLFRFHLIELVTRHKGKAAKSFTKPPTKKHLHDGTSLDEIKVITTLLRAISKMFLHKFKEICSTYDEETIRFAILESRENNLQDKIHFDSLLADEYHQIKVSKEILSYLSLHCSEKQLFDILFVMFWGVSERDAEKLYTWLYKDPLRLLTATSNSFCLINWRERIEFLSA